MRLFTFKTSWRRSCRLVGHVNICNFCLVIVVQDNRTSTKSGFMKLKAICKRRMSGAFVLEGSTARGNTQLNLERSRRSLRKGGGFRRRYLLNCARSRHSPHSSRTLTSLLDYFHNAKERRKFKVGLRVLYIPKLASLSEMYFVLRSKATASDYARN